MTRRGVLIVFVLIALVIVLGCGPEIALPSELSDNADNKTAASASKEGENETPLEEATPCSAGWTCLSLSQKIYRHANCSFGQRSDCRYGCANETCRAPPTCTIGVVCSGNHYRGLQVETCEFNWKEKCEYGCAEGKCLPAPPPENASSGSALIDEGPQPMISILAVGEMQEISGHNVSIALITEDQVMLSVDGRRSDWLMEGTVYIRGDLSLTIQEILFQSYSGGKRQIGYMVN